MAMHLTTGGIKGALNGAVPLTGAQAIIDIPVDKILLNPMNKNMPMDAVDELADSIMKNGQLQPIAVTVSKENPGKYQLYAGEQRLRAIRKLGRDTIKAYVLPEARSKEEEFAYFKDSNVVGRNNGSKQSKMVYYGIAMDMARHHFEELGANATEGDLKSYAAELLSNIKGMSVQSLYRIEQAEKLAPCILALEQYGISSWQTLTLAVGLTGYTDADGNPSLEPQEKLAKYVQDAYNSQIANGVEEPVVTRNDFAKLVKDVKELYGLDQPSTAKKAADTAKKDAPVLSHDKLVAKTSRGFAKLITEMPESGDKAEVLRDAFTHPVNTAKSTEERASAIERIRLIMDAARQALDDLGEA